MPTNKTLETALRLADQGIYVYWLKPNSKIPPKGGEHNATIDPILIQQWFTNNPTANLAINLQMSHLAVIDIDCHDKNSRGFQDVNHWIKQSGDQGACLKTYAEWSPRHGQHCFYRYDGEMPKSDINLSADVELLTDKIMIAPSTIVNDDYTGIYRPRYPLFAKELQIGQLQTLPKWSIELANKNWHAKHKSVTSFSFKVKGSDTERVPGRIIDELFTDLPVVNAHSYLTSLGKQLYGCGCTADTVQELLYEANDQLTNKLTDDDFIELFLGLNRGTAKENWTGNLFNTICSGTYYRNRHNWLCSIVGKIKSTGAKTMPAYKLMQLAYRHCDAGKEPFTFNEAKKIFYDLMRKGA